MQTALAVDSLSALLPDWRTHLRARNIAPSTIQSYLTVGTNFVVYLENQGMPTTASGVNRDHLEAFLADLGDRVSAATVAKHYRSLQQFFRWLTEDGEITESPMARMRPVKVPEQPVAVFSDDELRRLLKSCEGTSFENKRDTALIRFLFDSGVRASELIGLRLDDIDVDLQVARVMGKGRRGRDVPYGYKTADSLNKYIRARKVHPAKDSAALWVGKKGGLTASGLAQILERRGLNANVQGVHPHRFRHTWAHTWLAAGNQEQDLMRLAGWSSPQMLGRYGASAGAERARDAHRRSGLGDRL